MAVSIVSKSESLFSSNPVCIPILDKMILDEFSCTGALISYEIVRPLVLAPKDPTLAESRKNSKILNSVKTLTNKTTI